MADCIEQIRERLFEMQDLGYRDFHARLMPNIDKETIIGVRAPLLRKYALELSKSPQAECFLSELPHRYYEENNLHAFLIERIKDFDASAAAVNAFLPYVNNWATCDSMSPKAFAKNAEKLLPQIDEWLKSGQTYTVRFGIGMLMSHFLDERFLPEYLDMVARVKSGEYYIDMMIAWYFATALAKQYDSALPFIEGKQLDTWTHNKTIQKAIESYRLTDEQKMHLRTLKIKQRA